MIISRDISSGYRSSLSHPSVLIETDNWSSRSPCMANSQSKSSPFLSEISMQIPEAISLALPFKFSSTILAFSEPAAARRIPSSRAPSFSSPERERLIHSSHLSKRGLPIRSFLILAIVSFCDRERGNGTSSPSHSLKLLRFSKSIFEPSSHVS